MMDCAGENSPSTFWLFWFSAGFFGAESNEKDGVAFAPSAGAGFVATKTVTAGDRKRHDAPFCLYEVKAGLDWVVKFGLHGSVAGGRTDSNGKRLDLGRVLLATEAKKTSPPFTGSQ